MERRQALGEGHDAFVQVAAVDVERALLAGHRLDDSGVGVTDTGHVVVHVDVAAALGIEQVDALAPHDVQGRVVEQGRAGPQGAVAAGGKGCGTHDRPFLCIDGGANHSIAGKLPQPPAMNRHTNTGTSSDENTALRPIAMPAIVPATGSTEKARAAPMPWAATPTAKRRAA